jgi:hypothetical protein
LTHLPNPSYNQISIAYSNYILTFHSFLDEFYEILESLIVDTLESRNYYYYYNIYNLYNSLHYRHIQNLISEINEFKSFSERRPIKKRNKSNNKKKETEWIKDIQKQVDRSNDRIKRLSNKFKKCIPQKAIGKTIVKQITTFIESRYNKKIKNLLTSPTNN